MLTFCEAKADRYVEAPRVESVEIRMLWHDDYWDGPRSGILVYRGERCRFEVVAESDDEAVWSRKCVIIRLTPEQLADEEAWHELFRSHVGVHTDYDEQGRRAVGATLPREGWPGFYDRYRERQRPDYGPNEVLGWFEA